MKLKKVKQSNKKNPLHYEYCCFCSSFTSCLG